jgi:hypothetical protein
MGLQSNLAGQSKRRGLGLIICWRLSRGVFADRLLKRCLEPRRISTLRSLFLQSTSGRSSRLRKPWQSTLFQLVDLDDNHIIVK